MVHSLVGQLYLLQNFFISGQNVPEISCHGYSSSFWKDLESVAASSFWLPFSACLLCLSESLWKSAWTYATWVCCMETTHSLDIYDLQTHLNVSWQQFLSTDSLRVLHLFQESSFSPFQPFSIQTLLLGLYLAWLKEGDRILPPLSFYGFMSWLLLVFSSRV